MALRARWRAQSLQRTNPAKDARQHARADDVRSLDVSCWLRHGGGECLSDRMKDEYIAALDDLARIKSNDNPATFSGGPTPPWRPKPKRAFSLRPKRCAGSSPPPGPAL
jgi:hypothetical protein